MNSINEDSSSETEFDARAAEESLIEESFVLDIKKWALEYKIRHNALSALLKILNKHVQTETFPLDSRTLLQTPKSTKIVMLSGRENIIILDLKMLS